MNFLIAIALLAALIAVWAAAGIVGLILGGFLALILVVFFVNVARTEVETKYDRD